jgi:hypothetical protein
MSSTDPTILKALAEAQKRGTRLSALKARARPAAGASGGLPAMSNQYTDRDVITPTQFGRGA